MKYVFNKYTNYFGDISKFLEEPFLKKNLVLMSYLVNEKYLAETEDLTNSQIVKCCMIKWVGRQSTTLLDIW